jgi:hypothetical protein
MAKYGAHPLANTQALATVRTENAPGQCPTWPTRLLQDGQLACSVTVEHAAAVIASVFLDGARR